MSNMPHQMSKSTLTGYLLILGSAAMAAGCQSSAALSSANNNAAMIDFNSADPAVIQAQGAAFNAKLNANAKQHQQLFDDSQYPHSEHDAKQRLLTGIRQHLTSEHVAVARTNYQLVPFIEEGSIDADSSGLLRTIIETYAYGATSADDEGMSADSEPDDAEAAFDRLDADDYDYDEYGFDQDGFDRDGFDEYGYTREDYAADDIYDDAESDSRSGLAGLKNMNPRQMLGDYEALQKAKRDKKISPAQTPEDITASGAGTLGMMLGMLHKTPEQVAAANAYQYQHLTINSVSQHQPKARQIQSVYSYDYAAPTLQSSIQIPLALDFSNSRITLDPSAIMPLVALFNPQHTPLPDEMSAQTVDFGLPEAITEQLPPEVIYDITINAMQDSLAELAPEYFSAVDIKDDTFAKNVGAAKAVKVYFGSKQSGEIIGKMLKYMSQSLEDYVDARPNKYPDNSTLKTAIKKVQLYNQGYQSADVGALMQLIEAVAPISFNQVNYYYLDRGGRLLAKEQRVNIGGDLMGSTTRMITQTRYDDTSFLQHPLQELFAQSFNNKAAAIDGNAWLEAQRVQKQRLAAARYARYDYDYQDGYEDHNDDALDGIAGNP